MSDVLPDDDSCEDFVVSHHVLLITNSDKSSLNWQLLNMNTLWSIVGRPPKMGTLNPKMGILNPKLGILNPRMGIFDTQLKADQQMSKSITLMPQSL